MKNMSVKKIVAMIVGAAAVLAVAAVAAGLMALTLDFLLGRVERAFTSEGLLPQDQIKNLSLSVRSRRKAMAAALCGALLVVSVASYASIIA